MLFRSDRQRSFERIREELSNLNEYEVLEYRLCLQAASGVLTREEYKEAARELRPRLNSPPSSKPSVETQSVPQLPLSVIIIRAMDFIRSRSVKVQVASEDPAEAALYGSDIVMNAPD